MSIKENLYAVYGNYRQSRNMKKGIRHSWGNDRINVVFVNQYVPAWGKMDLLYSEMKKDERFQVYMLCVPENLQAETNETYLYFAEHGYEAIDAKLENGAWFDIKTLKPDYTLFTRPYDFYMPEVYQSHNVCTYSKICNFSYGLNLDRELTEMIYAQNFYKHTYMYFVEMESLIAKYQNIQKRGHKRGFLHSDCLGMIAFDSFMESKEAKTSSWEFANGQFKVIWTPRWTTDLAMGGSNFFTYKDFFCEFAKDNSSVDFLLRPHPLMFENFLRTGEMSEDEIIKYKNSVEEIPNMEFDQEKEYSGTFWNSDVLVTDYSSIIAEYFLTEKPLIFCTTNFELEPLDNLKMIMEGCYIVKNEQELTECLENLMSGNDPLQEKRHQIKLELFGKTLGKAVELTLDWFLSDSDCNKFDSSYVN